MSRIKAMWTIGNGYPEKAYYMLFNLTDKGNSVAISGLHGWIDPGQSIEIETAEESFKIGFRDREPGLFVPGAEWIAKPIVVTTDRSVHLSAERTIVQPKEPEFTDPSKVSSQSFFDTMTTNNIARTILINVFSKIPTVGAGISSVLGFLWPEDKPRDPIVLAEERMKAWVRGRFHAYDRDNLTLNLVGLRDNMRRYAKADSFSVRHDVFKDLLSIVTDKAPHFIKTDYTPGTIALASDFATMHLALLREQVLHAAEIYDSPSEKDIENFRTDLKEAIARYQGFIVNIALPGELAWREAQISVVFSEDKWRATVKDTVTREVHYFRTTGRHQIKQGTQQAVVAYYKALVVGDYEHTLRKNVVDPSMLWSFFDPSNAGTHPIALDRVVWAGPHSGLPFQVGNEHDFTFGPTISSGEGTIEAIDVWHADWIDALQLHFNGKSGAKLGGNGGKKTTISVKPGVFVTGVETWWEFDLFALRFHFSDGTKSARLGDPKSPSRATIHQLIAYPGHRLSALKIGDRRQELRFGFTPMPDFYEQKA